MSFDTVRFFDGTGEQPSTIVGGSPDVTAMLTNGNFLAQLTNVDIHGEVVTDASVPTPEYSFNPWGRVRRIEFPAPATELDAFGRRRVGRLAIEIKPPLDEDTMQTFINELNRATGPVYRDHRLGHEDSVTRITTEELRVLAVDGPRASVAVAG